MKFQSSTVRYLQSLAEKRCSVFPKEFKSREVWETYREWFLEGMREVLPLLPVKQDGEDTVCASIPLGNMGTLEEIQICVDENYDIRIHLYLPKEEVRTGACVLVCPGYLQEKRDPDIAEMCVELVESGIGAAAVEYTAAGSCGDRPDGETNLNNAAAIAACLGMNDLALRVAHNNGVLRYLKTRKEINPEKIGITGICQGSIALWYTAALCEEYKAIAPLCGTTTLEAEILEYTSTQGGWSGITPFVYGMLKYGDVQHLYGCFAPRPLLVLNNIMDRHWPYSGVQQVKNFCEQIYGLYQAEDKLSFRIENQRHAYDSIFRKAIVQFFQEYL